MDFSPMQIFIAILMFVPGYLFIHTYDYFLLKGKKSQFEKTIQVLISSTIIWLFAFLLPWLFPVVVDIKALILIIKMALEQNWNQAQISSAISIYTPVFIPIYVNINIYSFILAIILAMIRKYYIFDNIIRKITGRDRYKTVGLRFYTEQIGSTIAVCMKDAKKYIGVLVGAPDNDKDNAIIISHPFMVENGQIKKLAVTQMLVIISETSRIEVINERKGELKWQMIKKMLAFLWAKAKTSVRIS